MILSVQYLRAFASILVLLHHAAWKGEQYSTNPMGWFHIGTAGVDLFFIISGYIMSYMTYNKNINFVDFIKARIVRIIPLYWTLTTIALIIYLFFPGKINSSGGTTEIFSSYFLIFTKNKYLIQNGWTLSYEFYFYILFSLGFIFSGKYRFLVPVSIIFILIISGRIYNISDDSIYSFFSNPYLLEFAFGMIAFQYLNKFNANNLIALIFIFLSGFSFFILNNFGFIGYRVMYFGIPSLLLFIGIVSLEKYFITHKENYILKFFEKIGDSSYSLYLVHPFSLAALAIVLNKIDVSQYGVIFIFILIFGSIFSGHICYSLLEKNMHNFLKSFLVKK